MLTIKKYREALEQLSEKQQNLLKLLYQQGPFEDSNKIAAALKYKNFGAANLQIGTIGKKIAAILNHNITGTYDHPTGERTAYFTIVHRVFEGKWRLENNLREAIRLELIDSSDKSFYELPTEISEKDNYFFREGKAVYTLVNRYERDKSAREECLRLKGNICVGCGFSFETVYGKDISNNLVHVHHKRALAEIGLQEEKNVADDLVPLCPNCHAVVHSTKPMMTIEELVERRKRTH